MGFAALFLGIISLALVFFPPYGLAMLVPAGVGLVLAIAALIRRKTPARALPVTALVVNLLVVGVALLWPMIFAGPAMNNS